MNSQNTFEPTDIMNCPNLNTQGSIIVKDWNELTRMSKEFFVNVKTMNLDELENARKCFMLAYLGFEFPSTAIGDMHKTVSGPILFKLMGKIYFDRKFELEG